MGKHSLPTQEGYPMDIHQTSSNVSSAKYSSTFNLPFFAKRYPHRQNRPAEVLDAAPFVTPALNAQFWHTFRSGGSN